MRVGVALAFAALLVVPLVAWPAPARAQLKGDYVAGSSGLQNGSQAPAGLSVSLPVYVYLTDTIKNDHGDTVPTDRRVTTIQTGASLAWVTRFRIVGANFGSQIQAIAFAKSRTETSSLDVGSSLAFSDIFFQPIQLGWQTPRADFTAGWGFFAPSGTWELGGSDNSGLGMWSYDFQAGSTVRLDREQAWTTSLLATYETHSSKQGTRIKVGDILTLEGGTGRTFSKELKGESTPRTASVGLVYYAQWKVTGDEAVGPMRGLVLAGRKDRVYAAGLEGNVFLPKAKLLAGLRVMREFEARNRTEGVTFQFTLTYQAT
ncbi:MAG: SphA family protein [Candidatus Eiseniibacteriota bacterium]